MPGHRTWNWEVYEGMQVKLKSSVVPVSAITPTQQEDMFRLFDRYYANVRHAAFLADLAEKHWVIMLFDPRTDELCGFSTQMLLEMDVNGECVRGLFSGDTIVAHDYWGDVALARAWGRLALTLIDLHAPAEVYWFLISKGYKTYRFLPLFFHEFYPRYDVPTPDWACGLIHRFAQHKYPLAYDPTAGGILADLRKDYLRPGVADLTAERLRDPHVRFFKERNSGHVRGDELCCLAPLSRDNFTPEAYRMIGPESAIAEV